MRDPKRIDKILDRLFPSRITIQQETKREIFNELASQYGLESYEKEFSF